VRVVKEQTIEAYAESFPDAKSALESWVENARVSNWQSIGDVRRLYPHADAVTVNSSRTVIVFNVRGNKYRLIVAMHFNRQLVFVLRLLTHAEYSKNLWKGQL
jgi:mRNA interferase HigB